MTTPINLFADVPTRLPDELVTILLEAAGLRLERIVSHGHSTTPDTWYDQDGAEWVMILKGAARLRFEGDEHHVELNVGDVVNIPAANAIGSNGRPPTSRRYGWPCITESGNETCDVLSVRFHIDASLRRRATVGGRGQRSEMLRF